MATVQTGSLYVGDLAPEVTEGKLFEFFSDVGPVASIRVVRDVMSRRSRGYAYVNFHNLSDAERAIELKNFHVVDGKPCRIMWQRRDPALRKSGAGNVFVQGLKDDTDNQALLDTFSIFGNILSCKVVTDDAGKCRGYGYVHFDSPDGAKEAIEKLNGMLLNGQKVTVVPFIARGQRQAHGAWTNIYVKHFPKNWDEDRLRKEFSQFGTMNSVKVPTSEVTTRKNKATGEVINGDVAEGVEVEEETKTEARGYAFVNFETHEDAVKAVETMNEKDYEENGASFKLYVAQHKKKLDHEKEVSRFKEQKRAERNSTFAGKNLFVKNLAESIDDNRLRELFSPFGTIASAKIGKLESGAHAGFGFVCFSTVDEAEKAISELKGKLVEGKPLYVGIFQTKSQRAEANARHFAQLGFGAPYGFGRQGMYGMPNMMRGGAAGGRGANMPGNMMPQQRYPMPQYNMAGGMPMGGNPMMMKGRGGMMPPMMMGQMPFMPGMMPMQAPMQPRGQMGPRGPMNGPAGQQQGQGQGQRFPNQQRMMPNMPMQFNPMQFNPMMMQAMGMFPNMNMANMQRMMMPPQQQQQQQQGAAPGAAAPQGQQQFAYTQQARNKPAAAPAATAATAAAPSAAAGGEEESFDASHLANADPSELKDILGEKLYPRIEARQPANAPKITGMLLEMDSAELIGLLENNEALSAKIDEAVEVLKKHGQFADAE